MKTLQNARTSMRAHVISLADRTNGRAYAMRQSVVCKVCMVAKRCDLEQRLLLTVHRKSYMRNWLVPKWMTSTFV